MAQSDTFQRGRKIPKETVAAQTVPGSSTKLHTIYTQGVDRIMVHLTVATAALTGFVIKAKAHGETNASSLYSVAGDFTAPAGLLVGTSGDLTTLGVGTGWFIMEVTGLDTVELWATSGGTATLAFEIGGA